VMKEAVLDFASRHEIPPPSWWTDGTSVSTDADVTTKGAHSVSASPIPAPTHSARPRGRRPKKLDQVKEAMRKDIRLGQKTPHGLTDMLEKDLAASYGRQSRHRSQGARRRPVGNADRGARQASRQNWPRTSRPSCRKFNSRH
jgi:hypothetical protein